MKLTHQQLVDYIMDEITNKEFLEVMQDVIIECDNNLVAEVAKICLNELRPNHQIFSKFYRRCDKMINQLDRHYSLNKLPPED